MVVTALVAWGHEGRVGWRVRADVSPWASSGDERLHGWRSLTRWLSCSLTTGLYVDATAPPRARAGSVATQGASKVEKSAGKQSGNVAAKSVSGRVELAPALKAKANPDDVVFIFARAVDGPRMPLAAQRARVADLPLDFMLDDSQSVMQGATISSVDSVRIEVRVSKSGTANPGKGDLTGKSPAVKPGAKDVKIVIDQIDP